MIAETPATYSYDMQNALIHDINSILTSHGVGTQITVEDIICTENVIVDSGRSDGKLSNAIVGHIWPSIPTKRVYHYTSRESAESILSSGVFRLSNIEKRFSEGEIVTFCGTHELSGYLEPVDESGTPYYRANMMPRLFYASFTDTNVTDEQEDYFWRTFATSDGVRLELEIVAQNPDFRKVFYEQFQGEPIQLLNDMVTTINKKYNVKFILGGISRMCAFYLDGEDFDIENEYRMLYKVWPDFRQQPVTSGGESFVEIPLGGAIADCGYGITVTEVQALDCPSMPAGYNFSKRIPKS
jgi:hypothetical protein